MSHVDDVKGAVAAYHAALSSLNIAKIETRFGPRRQRDAT